MRYIALLFGLALIAGALCLWRYWKVEGAVCFLVGLCGYCTTSAALRGEIK